MAGEGKAVKRTPGSIYRSGGKTFKYTGGGNSTEVKKPKSQKVKSAGTVKTKVANKKGKQKKGKSSVKIKTIKYKK